MKRVTDKDIIELLEKLENPNSIDDELIMNEVLKTQLGLQFDIRNFLRKIYKSMNPRKQKVYTDPLKAGPKDIVIGRNDG